MRVEHRQLLMAVHHVEGVVDIERYGSGRLVVAAAIQRHHHPHVANTPAPWRFSAPEPLIFVPFHARAPLMTDHVLAGLVKRRAELSRPDRHHAGAAPAAPRGPRLPGRGDPPVGGF